MGRCCATRRPLTRGENQSVARPVEMAMSSTATPQPRLEAGNSRVGSDRCDEEVIDLFKRPPSESPTLGRPISCETKIERSLLCLKGPYSMRGGFIAEKRRE